MATLSVTFGRHIGTPGAPIMDGDKARSFKLTMPATSGFAAVSGENVVRVVASANCWVAIGTAPIAAIPTSSTSSRTHYVGQGGSLELAVETGEKVAVIADA